MTRSTKLLVAMLTIVATLLAANLIVMLIHGTAPTLARADIVSGKNFFTTHNPDGRTVFLWYYDYSGAPTDQQAYVKYLGQVEVGGMFQKP